VQRSSSQNRAANEALIAAYNAEIILEPLRAEQAEPGEGVRCDAETRAKSKDLTELKAANRLEFRQLENIVALLYSLGVKPWKT
jgi:hypothetical protein